MTLIQIDDLINKKRYIDKATLEIFIPIYIITTITQVICLTIFYIVDCIVDNNDNLRLKYKIQKKKINWIKYKETFYYIFKQHFIINIPMGILISLLWKWKGIDNSPYGYLSLNQIYKIIISYILADVIFYTGHIIIHQNKFYEIIHKQHHSWYDPSAISTTYAHPIEHILCNIVSVYIPIIITGLHWKLSLLWICLAIISVIISHCGYDIIGARKHDLHHSKIHVNYGPGGLCDWLFSTNE
jgi:sterol desaturase/sphingolipid hydroxylase (fatty acid hydroxylase superfamily)